MVTFNTAKCTHSTQRHQHLWLSKCNSYSVSKVCRFLLPGTNYDHDKCQHIMPKNDDVKKFIKFWSLYSAYWISSPTSKRFNAVIGSIAIALRLMYTDFPENHQRRPSWALRQWYKKVRSTGSVKRQKESERKSISDWHPIIVQQLPGAYPLSRASANVLTCCWTTCWTIVHECQQCTFYSSDLMHEAECRVQNLTNFFTSFLDMPIGTLALVMALICNGQ